MVLALSVGAAQQGYPQGSCRPVDGYVTSFLSDMGRIATTDDSESATARAHLKLPLVAESEVALVLDDSTCQVVALAFARATKSDTVSPAPIAVVRIGPTRYAAYTGETPATSEFATAVVMDEALKVLARFTR